MRRFEEGGDLYLLPSEFLSVLQFRAFNELLLPNPKSLKLGGVTENSVSFIPVLLPPGITSIFLTFEFDLPKTMIASTVTALPTLCLNLHTIGLYSLPGDPTITVAISRMLLVTNRSTLQQLYVDCPLTEAAIEVLYKLPNLCSLSVFIERETSLPSPSLPNITRLTITYDNDDG